MPRSASSLMRQTIVLQRRTVERGQYGGTKTVWADDVALCGSFEPLRGSEFFAAGGERDRLPQKIARVDARIRIRERQGISPSANRVKHGGVVYDIVAVIQDRERRQTQLMVAAVAVNQPDGGTVNA